MFLGKYDAWWSSGGGDASAGEQLQIQMKLHPPTWHSPPAVQPSSWQGMDWYQSIVWGLRTCALYSSVQIAHLDSQMCLVFSHSLRNLQCCILFVPTFPLLLVFFLQSYRCVHKDWHTTVFAVMFVTQKWIRTSVSITGTLLQYVRVELYNEWNALWLLIIIR